MKMSKNCPKNDLQQMDWLSTLSVEDSHARTSAQLVVEQDSQESVAVSGSSSTGSSKKSSRKSRSSKTSQPFALEDWTKFSGASLRSGMMRNGTVYPLQPLAPITKGTASGSWPTPTRHNAKEMGYPAEYTRNTLGLGTVILKPHLWPTPTTSSGGPNHQSAAVNERGHGINLAGAVQKWPTPQASDHRDRGCMEDPSIQRRIKLGKQIGLSTVVKEHRECGTLNPTWVEWLMGFPIGWTVLEHWVTRSSRKSQK